MNFPLLGNVPDRPNLPDPEAVTSKQKHLKADHDQAIEKLLADLNATQTVFPGTEFTLVFKLGSS